MATPGLGPTGFVSKSASEVRDDFRAAAQATMGGATLDLSSTSVLSQLIDVWAAQIADVWALGADLYASSYPAGATGVLVDHLLALNNLSRLAAAATVTNPTPLADAGGNTQYGLVFYGTAGAVVPAKTLISNGATQPAQFAVDAAVTVAAAINAQQAVYFSNAPTAGSYSLRLTAPSGEVLSTAPLSFAAQAQAVVLTFDGSDAGGKRDTWDIYIDGQVFYEVPYDDSAIPYLQSAFNSIPAYAGTTVSGNRTAGISIGAPGAAATLSFAQVSAPTAVRQSVQNAIRRLQASDGTLPFADVAVTSAAQSLLLQFGSVALPKGRANTAAQPIALAAVANSTLTAGTSVTITSVRHTAFGAPAQGVGTATCTKAGNVQVSAGQLKSLVNPVTGISGVTNQLDCIAGRDLESDNDALQRLQEQRGAGATGSLAAIVSRVLSVSGVTQAVGFQNETNASAQVLAFASPPATGTFSLLLAGQTTAALPYNATPAAVQAAIRALTGMDDATVSAADSGYQISFGPISGAVPHDLLQVPTNTTGIELLPFWGCPSHAIEVVAEGGTALDVSRAILSALPAGIATFGRPSLRTKASVTSGQQAIGLQSTAGVELGQYATASALPDAAQVQSLTSTGAVLSRAATSTNAAAPVAFGYGALLSDAAGNVVMVRFSRPRPVSIYIALTLKTDQALGAASQFDVASVAGIQATLLQTVNAIPIGSPVIVTGTNGLLNSFRAVPGVLSASIKVGRTANPTASDNVLMAANETPVAEAANVSISVI